MTSESNFTILSSQDYSNLSTFDQHDYTENLMGDRIKVTYKQALEALSSTLNSQNNKLFNAYKNFKELYCNDDSEIPSDLEVLINVSLDKFLEKIYFVVKNNENTLSHYTLNIPTGELSEPKELIFSKKAINNQKHFKNENRDESSNISKILFSLSPSKSIENIWNNSSLHHVIENDINQAKLASSNNSYEGDHEYAYIQKKFSLIEKNSTEQNQYRRNQMYSFFNPAHITISPHDIVNSLQILPKSACSIHLTLLN